MKRFTGIDAGFEVFDAPDGQSRPARDTNAAVFAWLETVGTGRHFLWVHYFDPHRPYRPPSPYAERFRSGPEQSAYLAERAFAPSRGRLSTGVINNRYDGEVRYVDAQIGELLGALGERGFDRENTVVVVLSDHGEGLHQHGERGHGGVWSEQLRVPLLMRVPGRPAARSDRLMSVADVVPALMELAELPGEAAFVHQARRGGRSSGDGADAFVFSQESSAPWKSDAGPRHVLTGAEWKFVLAPGGKPSLFHLPADPHELDDVAEQRPEVVARLRALVSARLEAQSARLARYREQSPETDTEIDPAIVDQLRSLGYVD